MFGRKKKKAEKIDNRPDFSDLSPKEQERVLALLQEMGDKIVANFQEAMDRRLETARAVVDERISAPDNRDDR